MWYVMVLYVFTLWNSKQAELQYCNILKLHKRHENFCCQRPLWYWVMVIKRHLDILCGTNRNLMRLSFTLYIGTRLWYFRSKPNKMRKDLRNLRRLRPKNPRQVPDALGRRQLARTLLSMLRLRSTSKPFLLHQKHQALLQSWLRPVNPTTKPDHYRDRLNSIVSTEYSALNVPDARIAFFLTSWWCAPNSTSFT